MRPGAERFQFGCQVAHACLIFSKNAVGVGQRLSLGVADITCAEDDDRNVGAPGQRLEVMEKREPVHHRHGEIEEG